MVFFEHGNVVISCLANSPYYLLSFTCVFNFQNIDRITVVTKYLAWETPEMAKYEYRIEAHYTTK